MRKSELFAEILECVAFETEITKEQILSKDNIKMWLMPAICWCTSAMRKGCILQT